MKLSEIIKASGFNVFYTPGDTENINISSVAVTELLSDLLMNSSEQLLLITSLTTEQTVRSAGITDVKAIIITNGKTAGKGMKIIAGDLGIPLIGTEMSNYETALVIGRLIKDI